MSEKKPCNCKAFLVKLLLIKGVQVQVVLRAEALYAAWVQRGVFWLSAAL